MKRPLIIHPNDLLRADCSAIPPETITDPIMQQLAADMIETMYSERGIGIAGPQVGVTKKICIIGKDADDSFKDDLVLINPTWERTSKKTAWDTEGCLSIPHTFGKVKRNLDIVLRAYDIDGNEFEREYHGFAARVIQHEVDHLRGVLFIDKGKGIYVEQPE
jgi:peptide deformylase